MVFDNESLGWDERLAACQQAIGVDFDDLEILRRCLTHSSTAPTRLESNERLEFLGDAVLGLVISDYLYRIYPDCPEGEMTRIKSAVVNRQACSRVSAKLGLNEFLIVGRGVTNTPTIPPSILSDVFESLIAAIYLDGGSEPVKAFISEHLLPEINARVTNGNDENYKSNLQQYSQKWFGEPPRYVLVEEKGTDHAKNFCIEAVVGEQHHASAWGANKKEAEQLAARNALADLSHTDVDSLKRIATHNEESEG